jgi:hypothetical protein
LDITHLADDGNSFYNALQASLQRRWGRGVLQFSYTWSKITDDVDGPANIVASIQDAYNFRAEHGIASYDTPQRFVAGYVYRLPFGAGGKYLATAPVLKTVTGGWELSGITEFQSGLPITIVQNNATGGFTSVQRPNQIGPAAPSDQSIAQWVNPNSFVPAPPFTAGNAVRYPLYGPGYANFDASLMRNFLLRERVRLQFRSEFYNLMNHANFKNPSNSAFVMGSATFGKITSDVGPRTMEFALRLFF